VQNLLFRPWRESQRTESQAGKAMLESKLQGKEVQEYIQQKQASFVEGKLKEKMALIHFPLMSDEARPEDAAAAMGWNPNSFQAWISKHPDTF